jgi:succinyl-CoA synthetase alpha subunit
LLQEQEGAPMISVDLRPGECNGGVAVVLRGELEVAGEASAAAVVPAGAACRHEVIAGLAGLVRRSRAQCGLPGAYADGSGVVRRRLRGSARLAFRAACCRSVPDVSPGMGAGRD